MVNTNTRPGLYGYKFVNNWLDRHPISGLLHHGIMRTIIVILTVAIFLSSCTAQRKGSLYAYRQPVLQGARPTVIVDESGKEKTQVIRESANIYLYLETPDTAINVKELWIKGIQHEAREVHLVQTPVLMYGQVKTVSPADTLVAKTMNKVWQITVGAEKSMNAQKPATNSKIRDNDVVVVCIVNDKERYYTASIKNLKPLALQ